VFIWQDCSCGRSLPLSSRRLPSSILFVLVYERALATIPAHSVKGARRQIGHRVERTFQYAAGKTTTVSKKVLWSRLRRMASEHPFFLRSLVFSTSELAMMRSSRSCPPRRQLLDLSSFTITNSDIKGPGLSH